MKRQTVTRHRRWVTVTAVKVPRGGGVIKFRSRYPVSLPPCCPVCRRRGGVGRATSVAFDVHLEDGGVMDEPIDGGDCHGLVGEDCVPSAEGLVGGDHDGTPLVARGDQLEQRTGLGLIVSGAGEITEE